MTKLTSREWAGITMMIVALVVGATTGFQQILLLLFAAGVYIAASA